MKLFLSTKLSSHYIINFVKQELTLNHFKNITQTENFAWFWSWSIDCTLKSEIWKLQNHVDKIINIESLNKNIFPQQKVIDLWSLCKTAIEKKMKENCAMTYFQYPRSISIKNETKWNVFELIKNIYFTEK